MGLPEIGGYTLPTDAPPGVVSWRMERSRAALLIHDMQGYFTRRFPRDAPPLSELVANIARLRRHCDERGVPVFYTAQPGQQDPVERGLQSAFWGPGMTSAPEDRDIVGPLVPGPQHRVLTKRRYSAFQRTPFEEELHAAGRDQLIVTGIYASIGCALTAADAFMRDVQPFFVVDAVADFSRARHDAAIAFVVERCAAPATVARVLDEL